jgi:catechol 2,3-dioxygenase-like lactoylglutathione lyase family enzyme
MTTTQISPFQAIQAIDYTVVFVRDMTAMRQFYQDILQFQFLRELSPNWLEFRIANNTLALS